MLCQYSYCGPGRPAMCEVAEPACAAGGWGDRGRGFELLDPPKTGQRGLECGGSRWAAGSWAESALADPAMPGPADKAQFDLDPVAWLNTADAPKTCQAFYQMASEISVIKIIVGFWEFWGKLTCRDTACLHGIESPDEDNRIGLSGLLCSDLEQQPILKRGLTSGHT